MPEAAKALLKRGFEELGMTTIWCGYYDGNYNSKRVQEKLGFVYHHTCYDVPVPLLNEVRIGHTNIMTKEHWENKFLFFFGRILFRIVVQKHEKKDYYNILYLSSSFICGL